VDRKGKQTALERLQNNIIGGRIAQNEKEIAGEQLERKDFIKKEETIHFLSTYLHKTGIMLEKKQEGVHTSIF
jgi:hypothetical protein